MRHIGEPRELPTKQLGTRPKRNARVSDGVSPRRCTFPVNSDLLLVDPSIRPFGSERGRAQCRCKNRRPERSRTVTILDIQVKRRGVSTPSRHRSSRNLDIFDMSEKSIMVPLKESPEFTRALPLALSIDPCSWT